MLDVEELAGVGEDKRLTLLACVVHTARTRVRDEVVTMFCKRMAAITSKAQDKLNELREEHRAESERLLGVFGDVLTGVREPSASPKPDKPPVRARTGTQVVSLAPRRRRSRSP